MRRKMKLFLVNEIEGFIFREGCKRKHYWGMFPKREHLWGMLPKREHLSGMFPKREH